MINSIKKLYPKFNIYINISKKIIDLNGKTINKKKLPCVIIYDDHYEIHKK